MMLLTKQNRKALPKLYAQDGKGYDAICYVKFFLGSWTWYATEFDGEDTFFGLVDGFEQEFGYFSLKDLQEVRGQFGLRVERDLYFEPTKLRDIPGVVVKFEMKQEDSPEPELPKMGRTQVVTEKLVQAQRGHTRDDVKRALRAEIYGWWFKIYRHVDLDHIVKIWREELGILRDDLPDNVVFAMKVGDDVTVCSYFCKTAADSTADKPDLFDSLYESFNAKYAELTNGEQL